MMKNKHSFLLFLLTGAVSLFFLSSFSSTPQPPANRIDVRAFGTKGNGRTNDTFAFQKAIKAAADTKHRTVHVPAGTYILDPLFLPSNFRLTGEETETAILKLSPSVDNQKMNRLINIDNAKNVLVENLTLDGNYAMHLNGIEHLHTLFIWDSQNIVLRNNRFQNAVGDGVSVSGSKKASREITITGNVFLNNHRSNLVVEQAHHIRIFNNRSISTIGRPALHFEPFEEINLFQADIHHNTFETNASKAYAIQIEGTPGDGNHYHNLHFYDNILKSEKGRFMIKETKGAKIENNHLNLSDLYIWFKNEKLLLKKNVLRTENGIIIEGHLGISTDTKIEKNTLTTLQNGITIKSGATDTSFEANSFTGSGKGYAAYLWATEKNILNTHFSGNLFHDFHSGITTDTYEDHLVEELFVRGNDFENIKAPAISAGRESSRRVVVENNRLKNAEPAEIGR